MFMFSFKCFNDRNQGVISLEFQTLASLAYNFSFSRIVWSTYEYFIINPVFKKSFTENKQRTDIEESLQNSLYIHSIWNVSIESVLNFGFVKAPFA